MTNHEKIGNLILKEKRVVNAEIYPNFVSINNIFIIFYKSGVIGWDCDIAESIIFPSWLQELASKIKNLKIKRF